jgi:hypothetical protein
MFRKSLSLIVMLAFVTGQLAVIPHAHGDSGEPFDHDARPHFHVAWFTHVGHCRDGGHAHPHEADASYSNPPSSNSKTGHSDHDSDAIYLPSDMGISLPTKSVGPLDNFLIDSSLGLAVVPATISTTACLADAFSPDECSPACPLYLALRALRN